MNKAKVSVIIPVYNVEKYLRECLDSVISQTLKDIEIICVNDGSPDNSLAILKEYARNDKRFVIIDKKNEGVGRARNDGINKATGEFVCFMDPDDFYPENDVLESLYNAAKNNNVLVACGEFAEYNGESISQNYSGIYKKYLFENDGIIDYKDFQFDYGYIRCIYNTKFLKDNKLYFPTYIRFQDPPFYCKTMLLAEKFYAMHKICYAYRISHKELKWTKSKIFGVLSGLHDNLKLANKYKLQDLKEICKDRLLSEYYNLIKTNLDFRNGLLFIRNLFLLEPKDYFKFISQQIFSIINNQNHKIITILFLKIKIKRKGADKC